MSTGVKDKNRESREIKEERENSSGKDLEVITTRRQRGERSTQESPFIDFLSHFKIVLEKT